MSANMRERAVKQYLSQFIDEETETLINQVNFDLFYGPSGLDDDYPGYQTAMDTLSRIFDEVPTVLFIEVSSEYVTDKEPEPCVPCLECDGDGEPCEYCDGEGWTEESLEDWSQLDRRQALAMVVGSELANSL